MRLLMFGTCSGTEPFPHRHHTAWGLEINGRIYWFDAGEGCAYTAHLMGTDLLSVSDIFISHPHMDHIAGLPHLLWTIRKLSVRSGKAPRYGDITVYSPNAESFLGVMAMLKNAEGHYQNSYQTVFHKTADGVLLQNGDITVTAKHNTHLPQTEEGYQSFSFQIEAENKRIVYTGDYESFEEPAPLIGDGCDALLIETGHHDPVEIVKRCQELSIGHIYFMHHGRAILQNVDAVLKECLAISKNVTFCNDEDTWEL